jgi:hypothetical protein
MACRSRLTLSLFHLVGTQHSSSFALLPSTMWGPGEKALTRSWQLDQGYLSLQNCQKMSFPYKSLIWWHIVIAAQNGLWQWQRIWKVKGRTQVGNVGLDSPKEKWTGISAFQSPGNERLWKQTNKSRSYFQKTFLFKRGHEGRKGLACPLCALLGWVTDLSPQLPYLDSRNNTTSCKDGLRDSVECTWYNIKTLEMLTMLESWEQWWRVQTMGKLGPTVSGEEDKGAICKDRAPWTLNNKRAAGKPGEASSQSEEKMSRKEGESHLPMSLTKLMGFKMFRPTLEVHLWLFPACSTG